EDALKITREVADALAFAHGCDVVHRDIKPENILLESGHAIVADFGIARAVNVAAGADLTATGISIGTPTYMSPEQFAGDRNVDARSDIYSLACVLYEMLAGEPPFTGPNAQAIFARRMTNPVPSLRTVREQIPEHVERVIVKALARTPADRFATAAHLVGALSETAPPAAPLVRKQPRLPLVAGVAIGLILLLAIAIVVVKTISGPALPASAARVAVLPFAVRGSESFAYLAEGMVDLLSRGLDGAGDLRTVDPATILTAVTRNAGEGILDVERARSIAQRVGAGLYVLGSINAIGGRVHIQAALYDESNTNAGAHTQASVDGDSAQIFELVDRLSAQLLVKRGQGLGSRLTETAAITTRSLVALKAYLDAERRLRAASLQPAKLDSAITMFQQAVNEDSTFALAHYRMAVAAGWANRHSMSTAAATRALALSDRLGERDRRLLAAYVDYRRGNANAAERQYRAVLTDYPDDLEALFQLADVLFNFNPLRGRSRGEAREAFSQVLDQDPGFL
ncbi:MAG: protein kinase, partial [Gemmatimonadaceae bacterium]